MALILSRPFLIVQSICALPTSNLEFDPSFPDVPSPFTQIKLQYQIIESIFELVPLANNPVSAGTALDIKKKIDTWFSDLPAVFRECDPDTQYNSTHNHLVRQRLQILCMGYSTYISILKPTVSEIMKNSSSSPAEIRIAQQLRSATIVAALRLIEVSEALFAICIPNSPKYFIVNFIPFDTATILCSTLLQDKENRITKRPEMLQAIGKSLAMAGVLKSITKTGTITWNALVVHISKLRLTESERKLVDPNGVVFSKQRKPTKRIAPPTEREEDHQQKQTPELCSQPELTDSNSSTASPLDFDWQFDPGQTLESVPILDADFNVLDSIWSWDDVDFPLNDLSNTFDTHETFL
jgi:hypothetical protein